MLPLSCHRELFHKRITHIQQESCTGYRDTKPGALARTVAQTPGAFMAVLAIMAVAGSLLPFFSPPSLNFSFETLTVQDHPVNAGPLVNEFLLSGNTHLLFAPGQAWSGACASPAACMCLRSCSIALPFRHLPRL